jgi:hypothetical protein
LTRGKTCQVPVSVDGVAYREVDDQIEVSSVAGVEVYRGAPPADLNHSLVPTAGSSIWMGTGLSAEPVRPGGDLDALDVEAK